MPRILCLGEILVDQIAIHAPSQRDQGLSWVAYPGGSPANIACALASLGESCGFVGCVGNDQTGQDLLALLKQKGINTAGVQVHPEARTREVYVKQDEAGDRQFVNSSGADSPIFADTKLQAEALPIELFQNAEVLVLGTLALAHKDSRAAVNRALKLAEEYYLRVVVDLNWRPSLWENPDPAPMLMYQILEYADFLKLSASEAKWLLGTTDPAEIGKKLDHLEAVLVTEGENGCSYMISDRQHHFGGFKINPVDTKDTTGAGDAFVAGFVHQLCQHKLLDLAKPQISDRMVKYACAVGTISTQSIGAISNLPSDAQVQEFMASNSYNSSN